MKRARILLVLGIWVAILPYLGFPYFWKNLLFTLTGLVLAFFAYILYKEFKASVSVKESGPKNFDTYSENNNLNA